MDAERRNISDFGWVEHVLEVVKRDSNDAHRQTATGAKPEAVASLALDLAGRSYLASSIALKAAHTLARIVKRLEANTGIDAAVVDELVSMAEHMQEIQQRGLSYKGNYQAAAEYKAGDVVTYRSCLWHCNDKSTPGYSPESHRNSWTKMLGAGA